MKRGTSLVCFFFILFPSVVIAEKHETIIAYITDLSGPGSFWGEPARAGAQLAEADLNKRGTPVKIVFGDHKLNPALGISEAEKISAVNGAQAFIVDFSPTAIAISSVSKRQKKLLISNGAAVSFLRTNPYAFKSFLNYSKGCEQIARRFRERNIESLAILKPNTEFGELCLEGTRKVYPKLVEEDYTLNENVSAQVLRLKQLGVSAVMSPSLEADTLNIFREMKRVDLHVPLGLVEADSCTEKVLSEYSDLLVDAVTFGLPEVNPDFVKRFHERYPSIAYRLEPSALAYLHVMLIARVLERCKDIECQISKMSSVSADEITGFRGWKDRVAVFDFTLKEWNGMESKELRRFQ